jgi:hypothetical protein
MFFQTHHRSLSLGLIPFLRAVHGLSFAVVAYKIYTSFAWMNRQLRTIREARARRPEIDDELNALEAQERLVATGIKEEHDLEASFGSKTEAGFEERKEEMEKSFELTKEQGASIDTMKKD